MARESVLCLGRMYFLLMLFGQDLFFATQQLAVTTKKLSLLNFTRTEKAERSLKIVLLFTFTFGPKITEWLKFCFSLQLKEYIHRYSRTWQ